MVAPRWSWTARIVSSPWSTLPAALLYAVLVAPLIPSSFADIANPTLDGIVALLSTPRGATVAWVHFLAFDYFVGRWAYLDARERGVPALLMSPILFVVLMFGPLGYCLYLAASSRWPKPSE